MDHSLGTTFSKTTSSFKENLPSHNKQKHFKLAINSELSMDHFSSRVSEIQEKNFMLEFTRKNWIEIRGKFYFRSKSRNRLISGIWILSTVFVASFARVFKNKSNSDAGDCRFKHFVQDCLKSDCRAGTFQLIYRLLCEPSAVCVVLLELWGPQINAIFQL